MIFERPPIIVAAKRSIVAPKQGALAGLTYYDLAAPVIQNALANAAISADHVDEIIVSNALGAGGNPARLCALAAGLPHRVAGLSIDRQCAGGLDAILVGAMMIASGAAQIIVAGGSESHSTRPLRYASATAATGLRPYDRPPFAPWADMDPDPDAAMWQVVQNRNLSQNEQDDWAIASHRKALNAREYLVHEITPLTNHALHDPYARDLNAAICKRAPKLAGSVSYANTAIAADGAAFVVMVSDTFAKANGLSGIQVLGGNTIGDDPRTPALSPIPAIDKTLHQAAIAPHSLTHIELMEAYAAQAILCARDCQLPLNRINQNGGALARGHPIGASGAILAVRLFHDMRGQSGLGLAAIAAAGGLGTAALFKS